MARKKNPGFYIYPDDITSSERCNALSRESTGVYFRLLLRLSKPPQAGVYRLADWVPRPNWSRSDVRKCLAIENKRDRLPLFAKWLAKNDLPWEKSEVLPCLQELFDRGIIIIEGDMLIQPRMAADNRFQLPDIDNDGDPMEWLNAVREAAERRVAELAEAAERGNNKGIKKGSKKSTPKSTEKEPENSRPRATHASPAPNQRALELGNNNKDNNSSSGSSSGSSTNKGTGKTKPATEAESSAAPATRRPVADNPPTLSDIQAYFDERAAQGKAFELISAEEFLDICEVGGWTIRNGQPILDWKAYLRQCEIWRQRHGDVPKGQPRGQAPGSQPTAGASPPRHGEAVPATPPAKGKYKKW